MDTKELLGMIIAIIAIAGGLSIGAIAVYFSSIQETKTKIASIEALNKERLAMIEKGMDPVLLDKKKTNDGYGPLLWGMLLCGTGLGVLTGYGIAHLTGINESIMMNCMAMILGGTGLILYYRIRKKKASKKEA